MHVGAIKVLIETKVKKLRLNGWTDEQIDRLMRIIYTGVENEIAYAEWKVERADANTQA